LRDVRLHGFAQHHAGEERAQLLGCPCPGRRLVDVAAAVSAIMSAAPPRTRDACERDACERDACERDACERDECERDECVAATRR
jgi:hypothetical protein